MGRPNLPTEMNSFLLKFPLQPKNGERYDSR
jgi:hypothetical protein